MEMHIQPSKIKVGNGNADLIAELFPYLHGKNIAEQIISAVHNDFTYLQNLTALLQRQ